MIIGNLYDFNFLLFDCFQLIVNGQTGEKVKKISFLWLFQKSL